MAIKKTTTKKAAKASTSSTSSGQAGSAQKKAAKKAPAKKVATKKAAKKVAAKKAAKKAPAKKAAKKAPAKASTSSTSSGQAGSARKKPAKKVATKKAAKTTIIANVDVGFGNSLFIRGEGAGLSWEKGSQLDNVSPYEWSYTTTAAKGEVSFKFLINDEAWSDGDNLTVAAGGSSISSPAFSW